MEIMNEVDVKAQEAEKAEPEFKGTLKEVINAMLLNDTDNCEVTHTLGDISVVIDITIKKITKAGEVLYDAEAPSEEESPDVEVVPISEEEYAQL